MIYYLCFNCHWYVLTGAFHHLENIPQPNRRDLELDIKQGFVKLGKGWLEYLEDRIDSEGTQCYGCCSRESGERHKYRMRYV